ncbi:ankyrin repeat domain-containing protein SOWAHA-like [Cololabis saira]|uniref:ankyrin repeat domain-containing protein SOWAHA-like n=1 Tax=Cololabis saira TaxID=129043 RepID=UPI002AD2328B|nr:ankyrin repeat domain-containing protein SOWAHA-like [Cololabis saira]
MATTLTQDSVLQFLQNNGGSVKNADLLLHFRNFIRDHAERDANRELFKTFVNTLATVRQVDGLSHVVLRKKFRRGGHAERGPPGPRRGPGGRTEPRQVKAARAPPARTDDPRQKLPRRRDEETAVLPAAGFLGKHDDNLKTNLNTKYEQPAQSNSPPGPCEGPGPAPAGRGAGVPGLPEASACDPGGQRLVSAPNPPGVGLPQDIRRAPPPHQASLDPQAAPRRARYRQSYKSAMSQSEDDDDDGEEEDVPVRRGSAGGMLPLNDPPNHMGKDMSASSPCLTDVSGPPPVISPLSSAASTKKLPQIYIQPAEGGILTPGTPPETGLKEDRGRLEVEVRSPPGNVMPVSCSLPPEPECFAPCSPQPPEPEPEPHLNLYWDQGCTQSSGAQLQSRQLPEEMGLLSSSCPSDAPWADAGLSSSSWSLLGSTTSPGRYSSSADLDASGGYLHDGGGSSEGSIPSPQLREHPSITRRVNSQLRTRMCLSLGADLDKLVQMEVREGGGGGNEVARLHRLHRISSSLSLHYNLSSSSLSSCATPPRCPSPALRIDGEERGRRRNFTRAGSLSSLYNGGQPSVPLEPREHAWMVKGAEGAWPDIYSLFREDPSLLNRRDFISGFTVLHWIAKHGDHRVLNTLWYGVEKVGLTLDVNAKSTGGQTPLHVAAIHGRKNMMRLLVKKYSADVRLRDTAGRRPWQYLSNASLEILHLLGAPARAAVTREGITGKVDSSLQPQQQRRHLRHHPSAASPRDKLQSHSGTTKVKRSSSIAALLKHKSLHRFYGHRSDSP